GGGAAHPRRLAPPTSRAAGAGARLRHEVSRARRGVRQVACVERGRCDGAARTGVAGYAPATPIASLPCGEALISRRRSSLLSPAAVEYRAAGRAEITSIMRHAGRDALNVGDVLLAKPHRVGLAGLALLLRPLLRRLLRLLRCGGQGCKRQRKAKD